MKKHLLKLSTFASLPLVSLAALSCSNNQNIIPPRDYEMINFETGLAFNSKGEITKYYYYDTNDYTNIVVPEYLVNNRILTSEYYGYKQRITSIGNDVFSAQTKYDGASGQYKPIYNEYAQYLTSITLPNSIETIGAGAFEETQLTEIILPDSVVNIGDGAFKYCTNLTSITLLSKKIKYIGTNAFYYSSNLKGELYISDSIVSIGSGAFYGTQISKVSVPNRNVYVSDSFPEGCEIIIRDEL